MPDPAGKEALREEASVWLARMKGPEAQQSRFAFEAWRRADPAHDAAYRSLEQSWRDSALVAHTPTGRARSLSRVRVPFHGIPAWQKTAAGVAGIVIVLAFSFLLYHALTARFAVLQLANAVGVPRSVRLADGSLVTLDTDSAITARLGGSRRSVHVSRGRVRFDVTHDPAHPFVVDADAGEIVARGTLFDVDTTRPAFAVTLYRGAVDVRVNEPHGPVGVSRRLLPGQRLVGTGTLPVIAAVPAGADRWASGILSFDNVPLADVAAEANRYSHHHIHVASAVARLKVTGAFRAGDNATFARSLGAALDLPASADSDGDWELGSR